MERVTALSCGAGGGSGAYGRIGRRGSLRRFQARGVYCDLANEGYKIAANSLGCAGPDARDLTLRGLPVSWGIAVRLRLKSVSWFSGRADSQGALVGIG